jgi:hypothetical protein
MRATTSKTTIFFFFEIAQGHDSQNRNQMWSQ